MICRNDLTRDCRNINFLLKEYPKGFGVGWQALGNKNLLLLFLLWCLPINDVEKQRTMYFADEDLYAAMEL